MDLETQSREADVGLETEGPSVTDLNRATVEELDALPGIGPWLAQRIVAYREERGGFRSPEELTNVPGIGRAAYEQLADRLVIVPSGAALIPTAREAVSEELEQAEKPAVYSVPEAPLLQETTPLEAEEAASREKRIPPAKEPPVTEKAPLPARAELTVSPPSPVPPREPSRRGGLAWLWSSLLGGLLGMLFTLLVFSGINGSLDLSNSRAVLGVQNQVSNLTAEMNSLRGEIDGLGQRLDALEGLTARMEKAESAVETLRQETVDLDGRAGALESELVSVAEEVSTVQAETQRVTTFFGRLQALLQDVFGTAPGPTPEAPAETPTPTQ